MDEPRVVLFCEDAGHELFARAMIRRIGREVGMRPRIESPSARGGHGRAVTELKTYQRAVHKGYCDPRIPDLLVVLIDANALGPTAMEREVRGAIDATLFPRFVVGCPDPHIERWCFADSEAFARVVGAAPPPDATSVNPDYKELLEAAILQAGQPIASSPMEYAPDLVEAMDLYRAGKHQPSLKRFAEELRGQLILLREAAGPEEAE